MRSSDVELVLSSPLVSSGDGALEYKYPLVTSSQYNAHICACLVFIGIIFTWASAEFLYDIDNFLVGAWLFVVSSIIFLYIDVLNWWVNNRVGCCCYSDKYTASYEEHVHLEFDPPSTLLGKCQRAENGIIGFIAIIASLAFTVGSIMFLPSVNAFEGALIIFIIGSAVIFVVQLFLMIKHRKDSLLCSLHCCGSGCGLFYIIGSIWFLPQFNKTAFDTNGAATFFIAGGACFLLVGLMFTYRVFFENTIRVDYRESATLSP